MNGRVLGTLPERGDIVIVTPPGRDEDYIKRVIGLPGDTVEVRRGRLILNGRPVKSVVEPSAMIPVDVNAPCSMDRFWGRMVETDAGRFCRLPIVRETLPNGVSYDTVDDGESPGDNYGPIRIPAGHLFLMGDNRDDSLDSRFQAAEGGVGMVPTENLIGRALVTFWSTDGSASWFKPWTWFSALRSDRIGNGYAGARK
jgi:signal peptidase I